MSMSDVMFDDVEYIDNVIDDIRYYLDESNFNYTGWSRKLSEIIAADLIAVREKMQALQHALDAEPIPVELVRKHGQPGVGDRLAEERANIESWTGETVPDGFPEFTKEDA